MRDVEIDRDIDLIACRRADLREAPFPGIRERLIYPALRTLEGRTDYLPE